MLQTHAKNNVSIHIRRQEVGIMVLKITANQRIVTAVELSAFAVTPLFHVFQQTLSYNTLTVTGLIVPVSQ